MSTSETIFVLGHEFKKMDDADYSAFAGAEPGCYICSMEQEKERESCIMIWDPVRDELAHITEDGTEVVWKIVRA